MDLLCIRQVDPVHQSPQTRTYGFFTKGTVPTFLLFTHLVFFLFPTIFAGWPSPTQFRRRLPGHVAFAALQVLFSRPYTDRASLATSLPLIGLLTQVSLGCIQLSPSCPFRRLHTFHFLRPARSYSRSLG